jgi:hypothetical protein
MTCTACQAHANNPLSGQYHFGCLSCCTRLVISTRPNKQAAAGMLAAISRYPQNPGRVRILESVAQALTKPPSALTSAGSQSGSA